MGRLSSPLISPSELAAKRAELRVIDARWYLPKHARDPYDEYLAGHIPGAIPIDLSLDLADTSSPLRNRYAAPELAARALSLKGLRREDEVVVYDSLGFSACRVAWLLDLYGQAGVAVLDGGLEAWREAGLPMETGGFVLPRPTSYLPAPRPLSRIAEKPEVAAGGACLIDARNPERWTGAPGDLQSGRIPGSHNIHYKALLEPGTARFRSPEALREVFEAAGALGDAPVIATCGSGVTACMLLWGLRLLGHDDARLYDGSFDEWHRDPSAPVRRG